MDRTARIQKNKRLMRGHRQGGFTLVELMVTLSIASIVLGSAYTVFSSQQKTYTNQQGVVDIQQNLRAGMYYMTREIRMAGYSQDDTDPDAGVVQAGPGTLHFTMDIFDAVDDDADGDLDGHWEAEVGFNDGLVTTVGEEIIYTIADDADGDGLPDTLTANGTPEPCPLIRNDVNVGAGGEAALMENVEAISFAYGFDADGDGHPDRSAGGNIIWAVDSGAGAGDGFLDRILDTNDDGNIDAGDTPGGASLTPTVSIEDICMVRICILVRSNVRDEKFADSSTFVVGLNRLTPNDHYRRRLLSASVMCRNMGG